MTTSNELLSLLRHVPGTVLAVGLRYAVMAGIAWLLGYVFFKRQWFHRKIIARYPLSSDVWREIRHSGVSVVVFGIVAALTILAIRHGWTQFYRHIAERGMPWFWASIGCAIVLHDTYFYWTHRLMHHRWFFGPFHRVHHLSKNPSPWAAYAFAPLEAVVEAGIFPLTVFLVPIHPGAFAIFMVWQIVFNILGHTGYEFHPRWVMTSPLRFLLNTPTNHIMHHEKMRGNYGLYFNVWDRLMGTNHPEYESRFLEVVSRPKTTARPEQALAQRQD